MPEGFCTLEDVRRALREESLPGDISQDNAIAVDAITAQTEWLEKTLDRHWYAPTGSDILNEATEITIPTGPKTRDDEHDIPTSSWLTTERQSRGRGFLFGTNPNEDTAERGGLTPKTWQGDYTKIRMERRDAESVGELLVADGDGYTDWVASNDHDGGTWPSSQGDDYVLRVNSGGWSDLYLDVTNLQDDTGNYELDTFSNAVYVTFDYGHEGIPRNVRRAVAFRAASDLTEDAAIQIPDNVRLRSVDALAEEFREKADELLEVYR